MIYAKFGDHDFNPYFNAKITPLNEKIENTTANYVNFGRMTEISILQNEQTVDV